MPSREVLEEIVRNIDVSIIPTKFVTMVKITDIHGSSRILKGQELAAFLECPDLFDPVETRIKLNAVAIKKAIMDDLDQLYAEVRRLQSLRPEY